MAAGILDAPNRTLHAAFVFATDAAQLKAMKENLGRRTSWGGYTAIDLDNAKMTVERPDHVTQTIGFDETTSFKKGGRGARMAGGDHGAQGACAAPTEGGESITLADIKGWTERESNGVDEERDIRADGAGGHGTGASPSWRCCVWRECAAESESESAIGGTELSRLRSRDCGRGVRGGSKGSANDVDGRSDAWWGLADGAAAGACTTSGDRCAGGSAGDGFPPRRVERSRDGWLRGRPVRVVGIPLPGVAVTAMNSLTGKKYATTTDIDGKYAMAIPRNGRYVVRAQLTGFADATQEVVLSGGGSAGCESRHHDCAQGYGFWVAAGEPRCCGRGSTGTERRVGAWRAGWHAGIEFETQARVLWMQRRVREMRGRRCRRCRGWETRRLTQ